MPGKILYISWSVPPDTSGSAIIALNLLRQFTREEMVVAGEKPYGKPPVHWEPEWPELVYVQYIWPFTGRGRRFWRFFQFPWMIVRCLWLIWKHRVDRIVAVFPRAQFLYAGYLLSRLTGCRYFAYLHNFYYSRVGLRLRFSRWAHRRVFKHAEHIFVMSEGMSRMLRDKRPELPQTPLVHGFSEPIPEFAPPPPVGSPMRLIFCGNLVSCADAARRLGQAIASTPDTILSIVSGEPRERLVELELLLPGTTVETLPREKIPQRLREADIVLLPHAFEYPAAAGDEFRTIFPTKTIEYLISGRPILAHCPADSFVAQFLQEHACALVVTEPDVAALRGAIERLRGDSDLRCQLVHAALVTAQMFQASRVAAEFRKWTT